MRKTIIVPLIGFLFLFSVNGVAQNAYEILKKSEDNMRGLSNHATITMSIIRPDWQRDMTMEIWSQGTEYSLIHITSPARDKGTAFLKRKKEIWNWQPKINKIIKLPPSMMGQSWMGSDFSNDDLVEESSTLKDYNQKILREEEYAGRICYVIELIPKEDAAVVWGKVLMWVDKKDFIQLKIESYDEDMFLVNTLSASKIKEIDGHVLATVLEVIPEDGEGKTVMKYKQIKFDIDFPKNFFSIQQLKRL